MVSFNQDFYKKVEQRGILVLPSNKGWVFQVEACVKGWRITQKAVHGPQSFTEYRPDLNSALIRLFRVYGQWVAYGVVEEWADEGR